jgi:hypothetical protein
MTLQLSGLHEVLRPYAEYAMRLGVQNGLKPTITSVYRDLAFQKQLRANYEKCVARDLYPSAASLIPGLSCRYPANEPGDSAHNFRLAWDSWVPEDTMALWVAIRRYVGWGVPDNDPIHAELPNWRSYVT